LKYELQVLLIDHERRTARIPKAKVVALTEEEALDPAIRAKALGNGFLRAVFGVGGVMPASIAMDLAVQRAIPFWADMNGDPFAELHALQIRQGGAMDLVTRDYIWDLARRVLVQADVLSAVSGPHRQVLLGQVGLLGRFGTDWEIGRRLVEIPPSVPHAWCEPCVMPARPAILREFALGASTRYVFHGGNWNAWLDHDSMGRALAEVLRRDESLRFVCCGVPVGPAGAQVRHALLQSLSEFGDRVLDLPPQALGEEDALIAHASTCFKMERLIPASETGASNRLLTMVRWGSHPVMTILSDLDALAVAHGLAAGVEPGDWERAAREIEVAAAGSSANRELAQSRGRSWLSTLTASALAEPINAWLKSGAPHWPSPSGNGEIDRWAHREGTPRAS
jgi:hypothetical protein